MKQYILSLLFMSASYMAGAQVTAPVPDMSSTTANNSATAHAMRFGYFSYKVVLEAMPECMAVKQHIMDLRKKYDAEMKRVEDEFNKKYEAFLEGQRDFAPSILQKRQAELQELMEKNMAFKKESTRLLQQAEEEAYKPLKNRLAMAIHRVGQEKGLAFICNTDNNALHFISSTAGVEVSGAILEALK